MTRGSINENKRSPDENIQAQTNKTVMYITPICRFQLKKSNANLFLVPIGLRVSFLQSLQLLNIQDHRAGIPMTAVIIDNMSCIDIEVVYLMPKYRPNGKMEFEKTIIVQNIVMLHLWARKSKGIIGSE